MISQKNDDPALGEVIYMPAGDPASVDNVADDSSKPYVVNGTLMVPGAENGHVEVYTLDGKMVDKLPVVDFSADLLDLAPASVYVLRVVAPSYSAVLKYCN